MKNCRREMASTFSIRLLVVLLCLSQIICFNIAIPISRSRNLELKSSHENFRTSEDINMANLKKRLEPMTMRRMVVELNDYPGSGANNRHTPRPQFGRSGCVDC